MDKFLALLLFIVSVGVMIFAFPNGITAILVGLIFASISILLIFKLPKDYGKDEIKFLTNIFVIGLLLRMVLATITYVFKLESFFGGDQRTYDLGGFLLMRIWLGEYLTTGETWLLRLVNTPSGWGMYYFVAAIYSVVGRNMLATQMINSVLGAATAVLIYSCAKKIYSNKRVARLAAILIAVFPSMITWSSQGFKDPIIVFLLVLSMNCILGLQEKFSLQKSSILLISMVGIYSLRFYLFYVLTAAVAASLLLGAKLSLESLTRRIVVVTILSFGIIYVGFLQNAQKQAEFFGNLENLNSSRLDQARTAESGFGKEYDVSTTEGVVAVLPIGFLYLMLAPFPWQISNFRQLATLPETLFWWSLIPLLISGLYFTIKTRLQKTVSMLFFTFILIIAYSIFQGNVGTAYRMRSQVQVFLFIFIAVGWTLIKERKENKEILKDSRASRRILVAQNNRNNNIQ